MTDMLDDLMPSFRSEYDEKSLGMLSDILSTLYANPERSVMREYIANAIDAHQIAGVTAPVKVTLPTRNAPTLVIQDFGDGLDMDAMRNTFFKYVASTKTDNDDQIGALGIGAKSAFALTKSWTVTNVYDGRKYVIASVNDAYGPPKQSVIVNGDPTDEPSGITVTIPISDRHLRHDWAASAARLIRWFPKGAVEFVYPHHLDTAHWTDKYASYGNVVWDHREDSWRTSYGGEDMYVVMCGIAYAVDTTTKQQINTQVHAEIMDVVQRIEGRARWALKDHYVSNPQRKSAFDDEDTENERVSKQIRAHIRLVEKFMERAFKSTILVDAGDIDFMPSRESVKGTPRTVDTIASAVLDTVNKFSAELVAIRKLDPPARVPAVRSFIKRTVPEAAGSTGLDAVGVHNVRTDVYRKGALFGLHRLIGETSNGASVTLVTGVDTSVPLYKVNVIESKELNRRGQFFTTPNPTAEVSGFGSIAALFSGAGSVFEPVMTLDAYKEAVKEVAPSGRQGGTVKHAWWRMYPNSDECVVSGTSTFDDLMDTLADEDVQVYITDGHYAASIESAARKGISGVVIFRGRRHVETFDRELGRPTRTMGQLEKDAEAEWTRQCVAAVSTMDLTALRRVTTCHVVSESYIRIINRVLESPYGDLLPSDHRARRMVQDYVKGGEIASSDPVLDNKVRTIITAIASKSGVASLIPDTIRETISSVESEPWMLLTAQDVRMGVAGALRHAAVYMAAVG